MLFRSFHCSREGLAPRGLLLLLAAWFSAGPAAAQSAAGFPNKSVRLSFLVLRCAAGLLALFAALLSSHAALAQASWPSRSVRIITTAPPGGGIDMLARVLAEEYSKTFGQPFIVESRPGGNGNIGVDLALRAPADGHTLFVGPTGPFSINAHITDSMPFNPKTDITPIAILGTSPMVLAVHPSVPARTLPELLSWVKAQGGKVNYASPGIASTTHLGMELLISLTGIKATHIPYKGGAATTTDLIAGHVSMGFLNTSTLIPLIRTGQLRAIAVAELRRIAAAPEIPTVAESGVPGFEATSWYGLGARAGTPPDIVNRLNEAAARALSRPEVLERLSKIGIEQRTMNPDQFAEFIKAETVKWGDLIRRTGAKAN